MEDNVSLSGHVINTACPYNKTPMTRDKWVGKCYMYTYYTLLAKKLCDSSFLGHHLDLIHYHFTTDRVMSFIF